MPATAKLNPESMTAASEAVTKTANIIREGLAQFDQARAAALKLRRECRAKLPHRPALLEWPIPLGARHLYPPAVDGDEFWPSDRLRELALGHVRFAGYRLGLEGDDARKIVDVPSAARRAADDALAQALAYERETALIMAPYETARRALVNKGEELLAALDVLLCADTDNPNDWAVMDDVADEVHAQLGGESKALAA